MKALNSLAAIGQESQEGGERDGANESEMWSEFMESRSVSQQAFHPRRVILEALI